MKESTCSGCGRKIHWGINQATQKKVPLDPGPVVYLVVETTRGTVEAIKQEKGKYMISHFSTCPNASEFSGSKSSRGRTPS